MKRAREQQPEPRDVGKNVELRALEQPSVALPFDPDGTTPIHGEPPELAEEIERSDPRTAASDAVGRSASAPVPLRLAPPPTRSPQPPTNPAYQRIIQRLVAFRGGRNHFTLLVVSSVPGEGASTVARNLAVALGASHPGSVVLVDCNLRTPSQHVHFAIGTTVGLANVLSGNASPKDAVREMPELGIAVLPSGLTDESPPQILTVSALQSVVTTLQSHYDWVVLDGPPVTSYPDASSLAMVADGTVVVLRAERTRSEVAEKAVKTLNDSGARVLGGVLNRRRYHIPEFIYKRL